MAAKKTITREKDAREAGLPISPISGPKTSRKSALYTWDELKECIDDLITQDGVSIFQACQLAGYTSTFPYYQARMAKRFGGLTPYFRILEALGYKVTLAVHVQKLTSEKHWRAHNPAIAKTIRERKKRRRKQIKHRYGAFAKQAEEII